MHIGRVGKKKWDEHVRAVENTWRHIEKEVEGLHLVYSRVRLYQDGLPVCGQEENIVRDLAGAGSHNHRLLLNLVERGARLTGTESPVFLLEEYELARQVLTSFESGRATRTGSKQQELGKTVLERRDRYIAQRIDETLQPGETGLLFLGLLHRLERCLSADIRVRKLTLR